MSSLKEENCAEHPVSHGGGDQKAQHPGQSPAGLRQNADVGDGVTNTRAGKEAEVKHGSWKLGSSQSVEQADHHEGNNVLQVILMTPGEQKHSYILVNKSHISKEKIDPTFE